MAKREWRRQCGWSRPRISSVTMVKVEVFEFFGELLTLRDLFWRKSETRIEKVNSLEDGT